MQPDLIGSTLYADIVLPLPLKALFTYAVPAELALEVQLGARVLVPFGARKLYSGLVWKLHDVRPKAGRLRGIIQVLDASPIITEAQTKHWEWMAAYYMATLGEVMRAALPSALKLASESRIGLHPYFQPSEHELDDTEQNLVSEVTLHGTISLADAGKVAGDVEVFPIIYSLVQQQVFTITEEVVKKYEPKREVRYRLNPAYATEEGLQKAFALIARAPKQADALLAYLKADPKKGAVAHSRLLEAGALAAAVKALATREMLLPETVKVARRPPEAVPPSLPFTLGAAQERVVAEIKAVHQTKDVALLHGVTGSGKTLVYVSLIQEALAAGKQVLVLVPEIALTTQLVDRLTGFLGTRAAVYHSKFSDAERVELWQEMLDGKHQLVIGARSAVFLPFQGLGLVVVDEEHEMSYKQHEPAPRYNGRDAALVLARLFNAKVVLGSATPAVETYHLAKGGFFGLVSLTERFAGMQMPHITLTDLREEEHKKELQGHFSGQLHRAILAKLALKEQVILFQNRRGFVPVIECGTCAHTPMCENCDITLTYHKGAERLKCHYCGFATRVPVVCEKCGSDALKMRGFGTEKIEEDMQALFPLARVARVDQDSTRSRHAFERIIRDLEEKRLDMLVGTQMVTKGLDFADVTLVGVMNADQPMKYPDFRAHERAFQILSQVSGRAGRKNKTGEVLLQTTNATHPLYQHILAHDYVGFFEEELPCRNAFLYPPFSRLIKIELRHADAHTCEGAAIALVQALSARLGDWVLGPAQPPVGRVRNQYIRCAMLKIPRAGYDITLVKKQLARLLDELRQQVEFKGVRIDIDVDPL